MHLTQQISYYTVGFHTDDLLVKMKDEDKDEWLVPYCCCNNLLITPLIEHSFALCAHALGMVVSSQTIR